MPVIVNFGTQDRYLLWGALYVKIQDPADLAGIKLAWPTITTWTCDATQHTALLTATQAVAAVNGSITFGGAVSIA